MHALLEIGIIFLVLCVLGIGRTLILITLWFVTLFCLSFWIEKDYSLWMVVIMTVPFIFAAICIVLHKFYPDEMREYLNESFFSSKPKVEKAAEEAAKRAIAKAMA